MSQNVVWRALFPLGRILATPGALDALERRGLKPDPFLARHVSGDWGDLCEEDRQTNNKALLLGYRILSAYPLDETEKLWIITESDRSTTTLLLPSEY
jgi:hypothetical protein